jgi:hypothetical protein
LEESFGNYDSVHNHRWDFASLVLIGCLRNRIFTLQASRGLNYRLYRFAGQGPDGNTIMINERGVSVAEMVATDMSAGTQYFMTTDAYHLIEPVRPEVCATLMLRRPYELKYSSVCLPEQKIVVTPKMGELTTPVAREVIGQVAALFRAKASLTGAS